MPCGKYGLIGEFWIFDGRRELYRGRARHGGFSIGLPVYLAEYILTMFITGRWPESINAPSRVAVAVT
jgi:hypothetical protein